MHACVFLHRGIEWREEADIKHQHHAGLTCGSFTDVCKTQKCTRIGLLRGIKHVRAQARECLYVCDVRVSQIISGGGEERQAADEDWQAGVETSGPVTVISVTGCTCEQPEAREKRRSIRRSAASHADGKAKSDYVHVRGAKTSRCSM